MKELLNKSAVWLCVLLPPVVFFAMFFIYTVNIPVNDDYKAVLNFINELINVDSIKDKIMLIFSQHNEHRIVYDRLWIIISYKLSEQVNFNFLALIGNLSLIGIFGIFYQKIREINLNIFYLFPISVLIFNISFWENMTFAMAAMSNLTIFLFSLLSIYFLTKNDLSKKQFFFSCIFFVMAIGTQGGGLMLIPLIIAVLVYKKQMKFLYVFLALTAIILSLYFYDYQKPDEAVPIMETLKNFKMRSILFAFALLGNAFNYYLIFTNDIDESIGITSIIGFVFFIIYLYSLKKEYYKKNLFAFSVMTLIIITAFVTGISRSHMGLSTAGASRYRITGVVFAIGLYFWFLDNYKDAKRFKMYVGIISLLYFTICGINQYEYLSYRKYKSLLGALKYQSGDYSALNGFEQEYYNKVLINSVKNKTYFLPSDKILTANFPFSEIQTNINGNVVSSQITQSIDSVIKIKDSFIIEGYAFDEKETNGQIISLGLQSEDGDIIYFSTKSIPRFDLNPYFHKINLRDSGFFARLNLINLKKGNYKIIVRLTKNNQIRLVETDKFLNYQ